MEVKIEKKEAFLGVGYKWEGTYQQAATGEIGILQQELSTRIQEIKHVLTPDTILGVSYSRKDDFTLYLCLEVSRIEDIPDGMVSLSVPARTYAVYIRKKDEFVDDVYKKLHQWISQQGYRTNLDELSNIEIYPAHIDPDEGIPEFTIMIAIET